MTAVGNAAVTKKAYSVTPLLDQSGSIVGFDPVTVQNDGTTVPLAMAYSTDEIGLGSFSRAVTGTSTYVFCRCSVCRWQRSAAFSTASPIQPAGGTPLFTSMDVGRQRP